MPAAEDRAPAPSSAAPMSAGAMLRLARESQGLHIGALAVALKVPVKKLEALEADQFDLLPDTVFIRALAASVCRTLKIEAEPILERLPATIGPRMKTHEAGINTPFRVAGQGSGLAFLDQLSKPLVLAVLVLLVGVVVLVFVPSWQLAKVASVLQLGTVTEILPLPASPSDPLPTGNRVAADGAAPPALLSNLKLSSSDAPLALQSSTLAASPAVPAAPSHAAAVLVPGSADTTGLLVLQAHGLSWIEVIDALGVVQVRKDIKVAEVLVVSGALPLSVVLGRADAVAVQVRGKSFDLKPFTKDNVARFEVK